jgi:hypothetical protein
MSIGDVRCEVDWLTAAADTAIGDRLGSAGQLQSLALINMLDNEFLQQLADNVVRARRDPPATSQIV